MSDLFRRQAVDHSTQRLAGEVVLASPLSIKLLGGLLVGVVFVALLFACFASYSRTETVTGWVVPSGGLIRVAARQSGRLEALTVQEGALVRGGAQLAVVRVSTDTDRGDAGETLKRQLAAEDDALRTGTRAAALKVAAQQRAITDRQAALSRQLAEARTQLQIRRRRAELAGASVTRGKALRDQGFLAVQSFDQLQATALEADQDVSDTRASILEIQQQISEQQSGRASLEAEASEVAATAAQREAGLAQRRTAAETERAVIATAPMSGRVLALPIEVGQSVGPESIVAILTPRGEELHAELFVPSRGIGFIKVGQEVRLMYEAFPYQTFGAARGVISEVSDTVLAPDQIAMPGTRINEPVFRVRVRLARQSVFAYGRDVVLRPGMGLTAEIISDRRSLLQWLLDPLYAVGRRA